MHGPGAPMPFGLVAKPFKSNPNADGMQRWREIAMPAPESKSHASIDRLRPVIQRKRLKARAMRKMMSRATCRRSKMSPAIMRIFPWQKSSMQFFIRTIAIEHGWTKLGMANNADNHMLHVGRGGEQSLRSAKRVQQLHQSDGP